MKIYQFAVMLHPSEDERKTGQSSKLIVDLTTVIAPNDNAATVLAGRAIPAEHLEHLDRIEVAIRPF